MSPATQRLYQPLLEQHLRDQRQMAFVAGPRQVGKTTTCRALSAGGAYFNWDNLDDRRTILAGPAAVAARLGLERLRARRQVVVFDEIHKHGRWKGFLKGFFDTYEKNVAVVVTGSSRLDVFRRGSDSLMGRYFLYRMHPLSVAELLHPSPPRSPIRPPRPLSNSDFTALWDHGGYPEPFRKRSSTFSTRWRQSRRQQLLREDIRDLTQIQELSQIEILFDLLAERAAQQLVLANLAGVVGVGPETVRRWLDTLSALHVGFLVRPWFANVAKSLRKEPKWYLTDWSGIADPGARAETFVACHLLKAVHTWEDLGLGRFELRYLRDKEKREVDFLVVRDRKPWFLVEVKKADTQLSPTLAYFQRQTGAEHAFQCVVDLPFENADCFARHDPVIVPARTLLSQLT